MSTHNAKRVDTYEENGVLQLHKIGFLLDMKRPVISSVFCQHLRDTLLEKILRRCGTYYQSGALFYQRLWTQRLSQIGFRVISVEKQAYHHLWEIRLCGSLTAQS